MVIKKVQQYLKTLEKQTIPQLSLNCVIFGFHEKKLKVVVNKIVLGEQVVSLLPGGYIGQKEDLSKAVVRIVRESTGLENILFQQFAVFGDSSRSFAHEFANVSGLGKTLDWLKKRFVTICYFALVDVNKIKLAPTQFLDAAEWLPVDERNALSMDHAAIVESARETLVKELSYTPIEAHLLPKKFTLPDLHTLLEQILERRIDRANFRRKILGSGLVVKVGKDGSSKRRPADLYSIKGGRSTRLIDTRFGF